eukprot:UN04771
MITPQNVGPYVYVNPVNHQPTLPLAFSIPNQQFLIDANKNLMGVHIFRELSLFSVIELIHLNKQ